MTLREEIIRRLDDLSTEQQELVLEYLEELAAASVGTPGQLLLEHLEELDYDSEDFSERM